MCESAFIFSSVEQKMRSHENATERQKIQPVEAEMLHTDGQTDRQT
jgi:hypothetical protein